MTGASRRGVFLSYRRDDTSEYAGRLHEGLARELGADRVFVDVASIEPGVDFVRAIEEALDRCHALLALIGPRWVDARDAHGHRRLDHTDDFVRREIEAAFERELRVIPVLVGGARVPGPSQVPDSLAALSRCQAFELDDQPWHESMAALIGVLTRSLRSSQRSGSAPASSPTSGPSTRRFENLPVVVSSFVGRDDELGQVTELIGAHRLVTLTGPGGAGKTRLALEVATTQVDRFVDGVWYVGLAPVTDPTLVPAAVADAVGVQQQAARSLTDVLAEWARDQNVLVVFDNCEHVIDASAELIEQMLTSGPRVRVLATSREPLRIDGETVWAIPGLELPESSNEADIATLAHTDSVRLFIDRASTARPDLPLGDADLRAIADITIRLDGLPPGHRTGRRPRRHALRAKHRPATGRPLPSPHGGSRTAGPRHQTLRAAIDWSYQLLDQPEQTVLRRLSVFASTFTLKAAEATAGHHIPVEDIAGIVFDLTANLSSHPYHPPTGTRPPPWPQPRFRILETIRQFAADQLEQTDGTTEADQARAVHSDYYLALAQQAEPELYRHQQGQWLAMLELEHDNIRLALSRRPPSPNGPPTSSR